MAVGKFTKKIPRRRWALLPKYVADDVLKKQTKTKLLWHDKSKAIYDVSHLH